MLSRKSTNYSNSSFVECGRYLINKFEETHFEQSNRDNDLSLKLNLDLKNNILKSKTNQSLMNDTVSKINI